MRENIQAAQIKRLYRMLEIDPILKPYGKVWFDCASGQHPERRPETPLDWLIMARKEYAVDAYGVRLPPDVIFQVLPSTGRRQIHADWYTNMWDCEYCCFDPIEETVTRWYRSHRNIFPFEGILESRRISGLKVDMREIFYDLGRL